MTESKVRGLKVYFQPNNLKIVDSYKIKNQNKMKEILEEILSKDSLYVTSRDLKSLLKEWKAHNRLYSLHIFRKRTKDCDFESKQKKISKIIYSIIGF